MPNGYGVPLGCVPCEHHRKLTPDSLTFQCLRHQIEVDMDMVCADFENEIHDPPAYDGPMEPGMLYAYVGVEGHGYPPPVEFVPLAAIDEFRGWDDARRKQAWAAAQKQANTRFDQRK